MVTLVAGKLWPEMKQYRTRILELYDDMSIQDIAAAINSHAPHHSIAELHLEMRNHAAACPLCRAVNEIRVAEGGRKARKTEKEALKNIKHSHSEAGLSGGGRE